MSPKKSKDPVSQLGRPLVYPRASAFYALSNCRASFGLSVRSGQEPPTTFSDRGTEVHQLISGVLEAELADPEVRDEAEALEQRRLSTFGPWYAQAESWSARREQELWFRAGLRPLYSGTPDLYEISARGELVLLSDYKTGWHPLDEIVATNCQIRAYVPLIDRELKSNIEQVVAAIHKPGKASPPAVFDREAIQLAADWAIEVVTHSTEKGPKTPNRGPWCKFCSGKVLCPLWRDELASLSEMAATAIDELPDTQLRAIGPKLEIAAQVIERLKARLEARVKDRPEFFSDWHFEPGDYRRSIEDVVEAYNALVVRTGALSAGEFLVCTRAVVTDIQTRLHRKHRWTVARTKDFMAEALAGIMQTKTNKAKLVYDPKTVDSQTP